MTGDTIAWFEERGIALKIEDDGRMFPVTNSSQTIINCFKSEAEKFGVEVLLQQAVKTIDKGDNSWQLTTNQSDFSCEKLMIASGSSPKMWKLLESLGHKIVFTCSIVIHF